MAWTSPRTWVAGELVTASLMNTHVRDNLIALKDPVSEQDEGIGSSDYTTTSSSFVDISADLSVTLTTTGSDVLSLINGTWGNTAGDCQLDLLEDAVSLSRQSDGIGRIITGAGTIMATAFFMSPAPSAASHTYKPQWKVSSGTFKLFNGGSVNVSPTFLVREVS